MDIVLLSKTPKTFSFSPLPVPVQVLFFFPPKENEPACLSTATGSGFFFFPNGLFFFFLPERSEPSAIPPCLCMYGSNFGAFTFLGSTGKRLTPPAFCQSANDRDLNVEIPFAPRFFPLFLPFSASFIFFHCSLDIPLGMYSPC